MSDDPADFTRIETKNVPVTVTLAKIGNEYIVDPCAEEELCMTSRLTVAVNSKGNIVSIHKGGLGSGISPSEINKMLLVMQLLTLKINDNSLRKRLDLEFCKEWIIY